MNPTQLGGHNTDPFSFMDIPGVPVLVFFASYLLGFAIVYLLRKRFKK